MPTPLKSIVANASWLLAQRTWSLAIAFITSIIVARYLGPSEFGLLSYALSFVSLFSFLSALGLKNLVIIDLVRYPEKSSQILGTTFYFKLFGGFLAYAFALFMAWSSFGEAGRSFWLVALLGLSFFFNSIKVIEIWNTSQTLSKFTAMSTMISGFCVTGLKLFLVLVSAPLFNFALAILAEWVLHVLMLCYFFRRKGQSFFFHHLNWSMGWGWLRYSWYLVLSAASASLYLKIDQVMLGYYKSMSEVGQYAVAARLSEAVYFVSGAVVTSVFPYLIRTRDKAHPSLYAQRMRQLYGILTLFAVSIALSVTLFAPSVVPVLYGNDFAMAGGVAMIHAWACVPVFLGNGMSQWIATERLFKFSLIRHGAGAIVNVGLNLVLIPKIGAYGAAFATVVSYFVANCFICLVLQKTRPQFFLMLTGWTEIFSKSLWKTLFSVLRRKT